MNPEQQTATDLPLAQPTCSDSSRHRQETESMLYGYGDDDEIEDDRPPTDWCRTNGWNSVRDCPTCGGSGQYDDCTPCPDCDDGMVDWP